MSNADILRAIQELTSRFTSLELKISKDTIDMVSIKENVEGIELQVKSTKDNMHAMDQRISGQETKSGDAECYSRRWNIKLYNLPEAANEPAEDTKQKVLVLFGLLAPEENN